LGDVCSKPQYGWTSKAGKSGKIKYLRTTDISDGIVDWITVPYCVELPPDVNKFQVRKNDILVSRAGSVGYNFRIKDDVPFPAVFASYLIRFKAYDPITAEYIDYFLKSREYWNQISDFAAGIAIPNVNASKLEELILPLPPLAEQRRIVAKLDAVMAKVEANKRRLEKIPPLLKRFRQSVLAAAVSGKLTEEWRLNNKSSAMDEIREVIERRKTSGIKKNRINISLRKDLTLPSIPDSWEWCDLEFLLDESSYFCYGVVQPGADVVNQQKLIRVQDLANGKILDSQLRGISWKIDNEYKRSKVKANDLLVTVVGTIGRTAIVNDSQNGFNIARAVARVPIRDFSPYYVKLFIDSSLGQDWLNNDAREVARKTLNLDQLRTLPVPIPPQREQEEIVQRVEQLFSLAEKIESRYIKAKGMLDKLPQSILAKAFRGELVEQDPDDEPAMGLLERIKQNSEASVGVKKR
jgi:type I restriction enzyme S subunit